MIDPIDRARLLELIKALEPYNNEDCPKWVVSLIEGMPTTEERNSKRDERGRRI